MPVDYNALADQARQPSGTVDYSALADQARRGPPPPQDKGFLATLGEDLLDFAKNGPTRIMDTLSGHPVEAVKDAMRESYQARQEHKARAAAAYKSGDYKEAFDQLFFGTVPFIGPTLGSIADEHKNQPGQAWAHAAEVIVPMLAPEVAELAPEAKVLTQRGITNAKEWLQQPGNAKIATGVAQAGGGVAGIHVPFVGAVGIARGLENIGRGIVERAGAAKTAAMLGGHDKALLDAIAGEDFLKMTPEGQAGVRNIADRLVSDPREAAAFTAKQSDEFRAANPPDPNYKLDIGPPVPEGESLRDVVARELAAQRTAEAPPRERGPVRPPLAEPPPPAPEIPSPAAGGGGPLRPPNYEELAAQARREALERKLTNPITTTQQDLGNGLKSTVYGVEGIPDAELQVVTRPDGSRSVATALVPEEIQGKGLGQRLYSEALKGGPIEMHPPGEASPAADRVHLALVRKGQAHIEVDPETGRRYLTTAAPTKPLEPWQLRETELVPYEDAIGRQHPIGTWAKDSAGDLMQLREVPIDDPRLQFPNGTPNPRSPEVQRLVEDIHAGNEPAPLIGLETGKGNIKILEGDHRAIAAQTAGRDKVKVWVSATDTRGALPESVNHAGAVERAIGEGKAVPAQVLADYQKEPPPRPPAAATPQHSPKETSARDAKAQRFAEALFAAMPEKDLDQIATGRLSDTQMANGMLPRWGNIADALGEENPSDETIGLIKQKYDALHEAPALAGKPEAQAIAQQLRDSMRESTITSSSAPAAAGAPERTTIGVTDAQGGQNAAHAGAAGEGATIPRPRAPLHPIAPGAETTVRVPGSDVAFSAHHKVRELEDVFASHNSQTFEKNPHYQLTNDRNYKDPQNAQRVIDQAQRFDPEYVLTKAPHATDGAPVIDANGNVLGGNSRTMTIERVYKEHPDAADNYKRQLIDRAHEYGLDPNQVAGMKEPILVREIPRQEWDRVGTTMQRAITDFNKTGTAALSGAERAGADARALTPATVEHIAQAMNASGADTLAHALDGKQGTDIVNRLIDEGVFTEAERPALIDPKTKAVTAAAKDRIGKALTGRLFRDTDQIARTPAELRNKLERIVAPLVQTEGKAGWDLIPDVRQAVDLLEEARTHGIKKLEDVLGQQVMFGGQKYTPRILQLAKAIAEETPTGLAKLFHDYAVGSRGSMFAQHTAEELFSEIFSKRKTAGRKKTNIGKLMP